MKLLQSSLTMNVLRLGLNSLVLVFGIRVLIVLFILVPLSTGLGLECQVFGHKTM